MSSRARFWIVTLAAACTVVVTASLGVWQLGRAALKESLASQIAERQTQPALESRQLPGAQDGVPALLHRSVQVRGEWVPQASVFLDNRPMAGRTGFLLVTPLRLDDGRVVLVQRGWVPRDFQDRLRVPTVDTPAGLVEVQGRLAPLPSRLFEFSGAESGLIRQNLDVPDFARQTGLSLLPVSVLQMGPSPEGLLRDWPRFEATVHKHHGYAAQWFAMSAVAAGLYVWFQLISPRRRRAIHDQNP